MELLFLAGQTTAIGITSRQHGTYHSSSYRAVCRLAVRYVSYSIWCGLIPGIWLLVFQPVGGR